MGKVHEKGLFPKTLLETGDAQGTQISGSLRKLWAHTRPMVTLGHALTAAPFSWQCWQASSCGCLLPLQHRARSNFPSWLQALPQPKGPNELFSHISQTRLGSIQVSFFIHSQHLHYGRTGDFGQKPDQQPAQQAARQNARRSAAPSSDGTQGKARSMAAPGSLLSAQFRSCVCRGSVGPGVTSVPTTRAVSNSLHLKALECL